MDAVFLWAWGGAARLTRLVVADKIAEPLHERVERRWRDREKRFQDNSLPIEVRQAAFRSKQRWVWFARLIGCFWCIGLWIFLGQTAGAALVAALDDGSSWRVLGGPWWWTVPNAALTAHWVYALANSYLDPAAK